MRIIKFIIIIGILGFIILYPFQRVEPIKYINRATGELRIEKVPGEQWINWLYNNPIGELSLEALVKRKVVSEMYGNRMDSPESANKIADFVKNYNIDLSISQKQEFSSFNNFFSRKLKENADQLTPIFIRLYLLLMERFWSIVILIIKTLLLKDIGLI